MTTDQYDIVRLVISALTPIIIVILGFWFNQRLKEIDKEQQERNRIYEEDKQSQKEEIERRYHPHIEFTIDALIHGPQQGYFIAEFVIYAHNKSLVRHEFKEIILCLFALICDINPASFAFRALKASIFC